MSMEPQDEFVHDYPKPLNQPWKENWYFNFVDREARAWGVNHVSLMRHKNKGRFSAFHVVDGEAIMYSEEREIDDDLKELTDGRLAFEFVEPFKSFRVTFGGDKHQVELDYEARFPYYDYAMAKRPGRDKNKATMLEHYEQALFCKGKVTKDGKERAIDCWGHRDHSWGFRNESKITGWNWVAIQFDDKTVNLYRAVIMKAFIGSGFISTADGATKIVRMNVDHTEFDGAEPVSSTFTAQDKDGKVWKFKSERFSNLYLPMTGKKEGVHIFENFAEFEDLETGQKGVGIDEYLINPEMR